MNLHNPAFGKDKRSRDSNVEKIISELTIIKEQALSLSILNKNFTFYNKVMLVLSPLQMMHPNIVKYYKTFLEGV